MEDRDGPQVCDRCGNGADRRFDPKAIQVVCSWTFNACMISDVEPSYAQQAAQERRNEEWERTRPKPRPSFEEHVKKELDARGIRHPNRLIEPDLQREFARGTG